jgi:AcrR family transcriptional regulator
MHQEKPLDRRIQKTRRLLLDSLVALVLEKGYDKVSIQDIIERANVGRSTFYAHFESKEHLLFSGFRRLTSGLSNKQMHSNEAPWSWFFRQLYDHVSENRDLAKAMIGKGGGNLIIGHLREALAQHFGNYLRGKQIHIAQAQLLSEAASGALIAMLSWWLENDTPFSADYMIAQSEAICERLMAEKQV